MNINNTNNLVWSVGKVSFENKCEILKQKGIVIWFTGISGSGKSTIAIEVENELMKLGKLAYRLDGDNIRHGLCSDLGFSEEDRNENIRRIAEVSALFRDAGLITLVAFISPYKKMREYAKERIGKGYFFEVYVKADLDICVKRDPKGLYEKAVRGEIQNFTGISSPYEEPHNPDLILDTGKMSVCDCTEKVLQLILKNLEKGV